MAIDQKTFHTLRQEPKNRTDVIPLALLRGFFERINGYFSQFEICAVFCGLLLSVRFKNWQRVTDYWQLVCVLQVFERQPAPVNRGAGGLFQTVNTRSLGAWETACYKIFNCVKSAPSICARELVLVK
jgi:hypothetical protein